MVIVEVFVEDQHLNIGKQAHVILYRVLNDKVPYL